MEGRVSAALVGVQGDGFEIISMKEVARVHPSLCQAGQGYAVVTSILKTSVA